MLLQIALHRCWSPKSGQCGGFSNAPLSPLELNIGITFGGLTRGLFVGFGTFTAMSFLLISPCHSFAVALFYAAIASLLLGQIGLIGGIWADKFDHLATITNFVITPLAFLSGTFYSVTQLPGFAYQVTQYNPFFYMIDGFRYALTGHAEVALVWRGLLLVLTLLASFSANMCCTRLAVKKLTPC